MQCHYESLRGNVSTSQVRHGPGWLATHDRAVFGYMVYDQFIQYAYDSPRDHDL